VFYFYIEGSQRTIKDEFLILFNWKKDPAREAGTVFLEVPAAFS
jgi:hypothetical protein